MERANHPEINSKPEEYLGTLNTVRNVYQEKQLQPLFVGGVITKALRFGSIEQIQIDCTTRTVRIPTAKDTYTALRPDGTPDDFDIIVNHPDQNYVNSITIHCGQCLAEQGFTHHFVSTEAVRYPDWRSRNILLQMVSGIDVDTKGQSHFTFGSIISPPVSEESMLPWTYMMEENGKEIISLPSFGPAYFGLRYLMRLPVRGSGGLRQKDRIPKIDAETERKTNKIHTLMSLRRKALKTAASQGYIVDDTAWKHFIVNLQNSKHQDLPTKIKAEFLHFYWQTLGPLSTAIAHGKGIFEQLAKLGNKFGG